MYNHRSKGGTENNPYPSDFFDCSSYTLARQKRTAACCGHYITTKALRTLILDTIRTVSTFAISNQEAFMEKCAPPPSSGSWKRPRMPSES